MVSPSDDLDLTQAQAFALQPHDLAELLGTVDSSLSATLSHLQAPADAQALHRTLHDLKGYLGLIAAPGLCQVVRQADQSAREGDLSTALALIQPGIPRLAGLQVALRAYRTGIIGG